jgi:hypothetical protein
MSITVTRAAREARFDYARQWLVGILFLVIFGMTAPSIAQNFTVDFSAASSAPALVKNFFGVYQTPFMGTAGLPPLTAMSPFLTEAGVQDLRYEIGWGKGDTFAYNQIAGTSTNPTIDFTQLDPFMQMLKNDNVTPLLAVTYDPTPFRNSGGAWQDVPNNLPEYQSVVQQYISHYAGLGFNTIYYEVWNEPDGGSPKWFFNGNQTDYGNVYNAILGALNASGAGDAKIGGPAIAYDDSYLTASGILNDRMDFASVHAYANAPSQLTNFRNALGSKNVPIFMTEYASSSTNGPTDPNSTYVGAMEFFRDAKMFLTQPNLKKVYWAQWVDDSLGMITYKLHRKSIFNAYKIYQTMLPVNRVTVTPDGTGGVDVMAATGSNNSGIVLWNTNTSAANVTADLQNIPGGSGTVNLYRIDSTHADYISDPSTEGLTINQQISYSGGTATWAGTIPAQAVVFLTAIPSSSSSPSISSVSPTTGNPGSAVTITGTNFGSSQGTSTVSFGGTAATVTGWSATSITATVPSLENGAVNVTVSVGGMLSNAVSFTVTGGSMSATAAFVNSDTKTEGSWEGVYGADGYNVIAGAVSYPSYATVSTTARSGSWTTTSTDPRALQVPGGSNRVAGYWVCPSNGAGCSYNIDLNLTDGKTHQVGLYALDWDNGGRAETITIKDALSGTTLDTETASSFQNGVYENWNISGHVTIVVTNTAGPNAVISGLFFGGASGPPPASATFVKKDTTTEGTWEGVYGADGYNVIAGAVSYPSYATISTTGRTGSWTTNTTDPRALQVPGGSNRVAGYWVCPSNGSGCNYTIDMNLTDGNTHQVSVYALDWDNNGRTETIAITNATTGASLNSQSVSSFQNGVYEVWNISGHVKITVTNTNPNTFNAVISGLFFH